MIKVINVTDIQNGKLALICLRFVYLRLSCISFCFFFRKIYTIDSCWYRHLIPLTHVSLPSAVVCAVCSSAAFWSDASSLKPAGLVCPGLHRFHP